MSATTLLDLPVELLQAVCLNLDWDDTDKLIPHRPDVFCLSLTCRGLRKAVLPLLFRIVTLRLRWVDDALVEPAILTLRRQYPHLAAHVRCVLIKASLGRSRDAEDKHFTLSEGLQDWLNPSGSDPKYGDDGGQHHKQRVNDVARAVLEKQHGLPGPSNRLREAQTRLGELASIDEGTARLASPTSSAMANVTERDEVKELHLRLQLEALIVVMLCFPPSVKSLVIEAVPNDRSQALQNCFTLNIVAMALRIFGDQLQRLTMITRPALFLGHLPHTTADDEGESENNILTDEVISKLKSVGTLIFAQQRIPSPQTRDLSSEYMMRWHTLSSSVTRLDLWNMTGEPRKLEQFIMGFDLLRTLTLKNVELDVRTQHAARRSSNEYWLNFLIELRRLKPELDFKLQYLLGSPVRVTYSPIPECGVRWLIDEAVPPGRSVDFERQTRLIEDFESFLPLWSAEDSERGSLAKEARKDGSLVDEALSNRWRGKG